jgi:hypothetical protein
MSQETHTGPSKTNWTLIRQLVLVGILILVAGAAVYDFKVARPGCHAAYERISAESDQRARSPEGPLTSVDIQKIVGKKPSQTVKGPNSYAEKFTWMAGFPLRKYFIWVVYTPRETGDPIFQTHFENEEIPPDLHPNYVYEAPVDTKLPDDPIATGAGSGGGGAGGTEDEKDTPPE